MPLQSMPRGRNRRTMPLIHARAQAIADLAGAGAAGKSGVHLGRPPRPHPGAVVGALIKVFGSDGSSSAFGELLAVGKANMPACWRATGLSTEQVQMLVPLRSDLVMLDLGRACGRLWCVMRANLLCWRCRLANNETGVIQPVRDQCRCELVHECGRHTLICDAVQGVRQA